MKVTITNTDFVCNVLTWMVLFLVQTLSSPRAKHPFLMGQCTSRKSAGAYAHNLTPGRPMATSNMKQHRLKGDQKVGPIILYTKHWMETKNWKMVYFFFSVLINQHFNTFFNISKAIRFTFRNKKWCFINWYKKSTKMQLFYKKTCLVYWKSNFYVSKIIFEKIHVSVLVSPTILAPAIA